MSRRRVGLIGTWADSLIGFRGPLIRECVESGYEVFAFAVDYDHARAERVRRHGAKPVHYRLDRTGTNPLLDFRSTVELTALLRRHEIDMTLAYFLKPVVYASMAARAAGIARRFALLPGLGYHFTNVPGAARVRQGIGTHVLKQLLRASLPLNERVFLYNDDDIRELTRLRLVEPERVERLNGTGVDLGEYRVAPSVTDPVTFLMAGRLLVEKGVREFVTAARLVRANHPRARFILLGGIDSNPGSLTTTEVKQLVRESGLEWPGHVSDVRAWIEKASVYVLPSYREGVPRSSQEAMAMGRPVITTDAVGCRETVEEGRNGFLVSIKDAAALAERMARFIQTPELIVRMGRESRRIAEERFDVHEINARILNVMGIHSNRTVAAVSS